MTDHKATKEDWITELPPEYLIQIKLDLEYTQEEYDELMLGLVPKVMEDKWFIYSEGDWLYFHRSWTGAFIGKIKFRQEAFKFITDELWVVPGDSSECIMPPKPQLYESLIAGLLLGRDVSYYPQGSLANHVLVGRGRSRREKIEHGIKIKIEKSEQNDKNDT